MEINCLRSLLTAAFFAFFTLSAFAQTDWDGSANSDWFNADNWSAGVPDANDDVNIPGGMPNQPTIGAAGAWAKSVTVQAAATLTIASAGTLTIEGAVAYSFFTQAMVNLGTVENNGALTATTSPGDLGVHNLGTFNNNAGSQITIDRAVNSSILNWSGLFTNAGTITIGSISGGRFGIRNVATFNNFASGVINIDRVTSVGGPYGLVNGSTFNNSGSIIIGANGIGGIDGLQNYATFNNNPGGQIKIDRTSGGGGLHNQGGTFTNQSSIIIGANGGLGGVFGVWNNGNATLNNSTCDALIQVASDHRIFTESGTFSNAGRIIENASGNSNITNNSGIVQNLNNGTFTIATNTGLLATFEGALSACCPPGNIFYVNAAATGANDGTSWADAFTDLQSALLSPCAGLTQIWVAEGAYKPTSGTDRSISFAMKNGVEILGGFPNTGDPGLGDRDWSAHVTTLSGNIGDQGLSTDNSYHVIFNNFTSGSPLTSTAVLDGFTVTSGYASGIAPHCHGGGMYNLYASPTVTNCIFSNNTAQRSNATSADSRGGGMYNSYSAPSVTYCTFSGNEARSVNFSGQNCGGAMYNDQSTMTVSHCTFNNNTTPNSDEDTYGGGMCNINMTITINDCTFSGNAACYGGGVYSSNSATTTNNCTFSANALDTYPGGVNGSGMFLNACSGSVAHCDFTGNLNHSALGIQHGSPIEVSYCTILNNPVYGMTLQTAAPNITNCLFAGNNFGGLANWYGGVNAPVITNCTFSENPTFPNLGAITNYGASTATLKNCILWGAGPSVHNPNGVVNISYSDVKQASGIYPGTGNINADPLFISSADFHLQNTSPCINTGTPTGAPADDFDGDARPFGGGLDMGYDENTNSCTPPTVNTPMVTQPTCALPTGTIVVDASGGGTLEYSVDNGATWDLNETFAGLALGNYYIKVRLEANPSCETAYAGNPVELNSPFAPSTTTDTWTGCVSTDWATAGNWADGSVPTATIDVIIPDVANDPVIMGGTAALAKSVLVQAGAVFTIEAMGSLAINGSTGFALENYGNLDNSGALRIGNISSVADRGIVQRNGGTMNNKPGGLIQIDRISAVEAFYTDGTVNNEATIEIGSVAAVTGNGVSVDGSGTFNNNAGGLLTIRLSTNFGIQNNGTFNNNACATLIVFDNLNNMGAFANAGLFTINTTEAHTNSALTNNGIIEYPQGNPIPNVTNHEIIIAPIIDVYCEAISPAFGLGSMVNFNILGVFTDAAATVSAGTYSLATNTFTPNPSLSKGNFDFFVKIQDPLAMCTHIVPWKLTMLNCCPAPGTIWYVNTAAAPDGNGASWDCAFQDLQLALAAAGSGHQIWVAEGTYKPTSGIDRNISFNMKNGVEILGGFPNTGDPGLSERNWTTHVTVLSGDIGAAGMADNTHFIVKNNGTDNTAVLDGFQVAFGNANELSESRGGGLNNGDNSSPTIRNCAFMSNSASYGAAVYNRLNCFPTFTNCVFIGNQADNWGGAILSESTSVVTLINCSFSGNVGAPGVIYSNGLAATVKNCIFWGNGTESIAGQANITHSIVQQPGGVYPGTGNLNLDPLFVSPPPNGLGTAGDLRLQNCSPAIDAGNDAYNSAALDLGGLPRKYEGIAGGQKIDMGAYEFQGSAPLPIADCQNFTAYLDANGSVAVAASDISDDSSSPCGPATLSINGQTSLHFNCSEVGQHTVALTVYSEQSNRSATCTTVVTVNDNTAPNITCPANQTAVPTNATTCTAVVQNINAVVSDNCAAPLLTYTRANATTGGGNGQASGLSFNSGLTTVTYTVTDAAGNTANCAFSVSVAPCLSGKIIWKQDNTSGVKNVAVNITGDQNTHFLTGVNGLYSFIFPTGSNFTIIPNKDANKLNGVNAQDVFRIQQHNSGNLITDPHQLIAADVNSNNNISALDANIIQLALLGNPSALAQMAKSWRFVPTSHSMNNPPWGFPESIVVSANGNQTGLDFYGIKVGDVVAAHANPANAGQGNPFVLRTMDQTLEAGTAIAVEFRADPLSDLVALQFALRFDPQALQLAKTESLGGLPLTADNFGAYDAENGSLRLVWATDKSLALKQTTDVIRLTFNVLETGGRLSDLLQLDPETLAGHVYNSLSMESDVLLRFDASTAVGNPQAAAQVQLFQNWPNPFVSNTSIGFVLPEACEARLRILDAAGRVVAERNKQYPAGRHEEAFGLSATPGILYYELTTPLGVQTKKMVKAE